MALDKYGLGATWEDEEERRRREREAREQQRLGIAGAPLRIEGKPVQYTTPAQPTRETAKRQRIDDELSPYFSEVAKDAGRRVATKDGKANGMLGEYFALRNKVGEETLLARFNTVAALADRYMSHYETSGIIWDMVRSPYSEEQIDFMMRKGSEALYDPSWRHPDVPPVSAALLKEMGVDPTDELLGREIGSVMQETGGLFMRPQSKGMAFELRFPSVGGNIRAPWDYAKSVLGAVGRAGEWFGEKAGGALEYLSPEGAAERELDTIARNRAKDKGIDERFARFTMPGYEGFQNFISAAHNVPTDDLAAMQREIQKDEYDENNNIVREGYGEGLEPNGMMTTEWRYAFEKDWRRRTNETMQLQRMLLVRGYVGDNLEVDANIQTPEWQEGIARYTNQMARNSEWMADDPVGFATAQAIGDPRTDGGWTALARRLLSHGGPQAVYGSGVTIAKAVAGGVAAAFAEADLNARAQNSPTTKQVVDNAWEYLSGELSDEEKRKFLLFGRQSEQRQEVVKTLEGLAESDPVAKQHLQAINVELGMLITQRFRPNIYTTVGHMLELPYGEVEKSYQNNLDAAEGLNIVAEIFGSGAFGSASRASRALRPLERTEIALANSARATRIVDSTIEYIRDKDFRKAAEELQGTHAPKVVKTVDDAVHGRNTTLVRDMWQDLAEKTEQAIKSGDAGAIEELFPHVSDAAEFIGDVKKRAGGELDKTTKPTRLNLEKPPSKRLSTEIADLVDGADYTTVLKTSVLQRALKPAKSKTQSAALKEFVEEVDYGTSMMPPGKSRLYHVTTAKTKVLDEGLKSDEQLVSEYGPGGFGGLEGGSFTTGKVSVGWSEADAVARAERLKVAVRTARGELTGEELASTVISWIRGTKRGSTTVDDVYAYKELRNVIPEFQGIKRTSAEGQALASTPEGKARIHAALDELMKTEEGRALVYREIVVHFDKNADTTVGMNANFQAIAKVDPNEIGVVQVAARRNSTPVVREVERELRFDPKDLVVVGGKQLVLGSKPVTITKILALIEKDIPDPSARAVVTKELVQRVDDLGYDSSALRKLLGMDALKPPDPVGAVNKALRARQRAKGDIVNLDDFAKRTIYDAWTGGPERQALDVLTRIENPNIGNPGRIWRALDSSIDATLPRNVRNLWYAFTKPVRGAPLPEVELWRPDTSKRIWDYAFHASNGDAAFANTITNRYIRAAATEDLNAVKRIGDQLAGKANDKYVLKGGRAAGDELDERLRQVAEADPELYRLAGERPLAIDPKTGKATGAYTTNDGLVITPPQDTVYQMNKLKLGRAFMWAERKVPEDAGELAKAMYWIDNNIVRRAGWGATQLNNRLRAYTVGARPQLFFKHGIVDTARSFVNDWQSVLRPLHNSKKFNEWMDTLDADSANFVRAERFRGHTGELIYNMGHKYRKFKAQRVWDMDARGPFPRRLNKAADSYRRMAGGKVYRAYATGGEKAVREYLATPEGVKFLREGGHLKRAADELAEIDIVGKHKKPKVDEWAIENYVDTYVRGIFEGLDEVAPDVADTLKRMAKNETPLNTKDIKKAIKEAGPDQNPYLSIEQAKGVMELGGPTVAASRRLTGIWMTPNKMNRDVTFNRVFNQTMDKLTKEGIDLNSASVIAAHAARATTERVHFDLANALWVEQKHRWYAWFGTKHRLYATYLARMAAENPTLTLPITGIVDWMEARNAEDNVQEWDKQNLRFSMFGQDVEVNLHTLTWLAEYPLQSAFGHLADLGVATAVSSVGYDMKWDPGTFGISFGAHDSLVRTMYEVVKSPAGLPGGEVVTEEQLTDWLQALPPDKQEMWNRSINLEMAEARLLHDEDIEPAEAYNRAVWRTMKHEFWNAFRPFPGSFISEGSKERNDIMHRYMKASPTQRSRMLKNEPSLRYLFGLEEDTATMFHLDEAMGRFNELRDTYSKQVLEGDRSGKLYTDPEEWKRISAEYNVAVDALKRENPYFAEHMSQQWDATFEDRMQLTWPLVDIPAVFEAGRPRTEDEKTLFKQPLMEAFIAKLEDLGMTKGDSNHPYYQRLREDMVDRPMREYTGYDEADPSWKEVTIARYMARGGAAGVAASMSYKRIIESKQRTDYLQAGLLEGRPVGSRPWMAMLSTEQKYRMGWNSSREQEERWLVWSETKAQLEQQMAELKINSTSKQGKAYLNGTLEALAESWKTEDPDWYREWQVSQLGLLDRMRLFGFGDGDRPIDSSWTAFMDTMEDMQADMASAKLKTLDGKKAGPIADEYLARILALKEEDEQWWKAFRYTFTMTDFGFGKWRLPGGRSDILFSSEVE